MLLALSCYYYVVLLLYAVLAAASPWTGLALASLAWMTNVIAGPLTSLEGQYASMSPAAVAFVGGVTAGFDWRRSPGAGL